MESGSQWGAAHRGSARLGQPSGDSITHDHNAQLAQGVLVEEFPYKPVDVKRGRGVRWGHSQSAGSPRFAHLSRIRQTMAPR